MLKKIKSSHGFTLVEVMIVVAIVGVLASMAVPNFMRSKQSAQEAACIANMRMIYGAVNIALLNGELGTRDGNAHNPGHDYQIWSSDPNRGLVTRYLNSKPYCPYGSRSEQEQFMRYHAIPEGDTIIVVCDYYDADLHNVDPEGRTTDDFFGE